MTLGEKIKAARKQAGLSQEQLAEKMSVSRSAVAKWETDKGLPDIDNLKAISQFLNVSIDYLLADGEPLPEIVTKESYDLSNYGKGLKKAKKDRVMLEKYPDADIYTLLGKVKLTKGERVIDNILGFFTDAPFGTPDLVHGLRNLDKEFYLVEKDEKQFFVTVTDEFIETRQLTKPIREKKFELGGWEFQRIARKVTPAKS